MGLHTSSCGFSSVLESHVAQSHEMFRLQKFALYSKKQRSEAKLVNKIKNTWGQDAVIAYGSWARKYNRKGLAPCPNEGMRRLLKNNRFTVVNVPEYNTTKTCSKCEVGIMEPIHEMNRVIRGKEKKGKVEVRGLRRCNNVSCAIYMNRDYNAAINIRKNLFYFIAKENGIPPSLEEHIWSR